MKGRKGKENDVIDTKMQQPESNWESFTLEDVCSYSKSPRGQKAEKAIYAQAQNKSQEV